MGMLVGTRPVLDAARIVLDCRRRSPRSRRSRPPALLPRILDITVTPHCDARTSFLDITYSPSAPPHITHKGPPRIAIALYIRITTDASFSFRSLGSRHRPGRVDRLVLAPSPHSAPVFFSPLPSIFLLFVPINRLTLLALSNPSRFPVSPAHARAHTV